MHLTNNNIMVRIKWCFRIQVNWSRTKSQIVKNWLLTKLTFNIIIVCIPILFSSGLAFEMKNVWNCLLSPHHVASLCHWEIKGQELGKSSPMCVQCWDNTKEWARECVLQSQFHFTQFSTFSFLFSSECCCDPPQKDQILTFSWTIVDFLAKFHKW